MIDQGELGCMLPSDAEHSLRFSSIQSSGLFAEYVLAVLQRSHGDVGMFGRWGDDADKIDLIVLDQLPPVLKESRDVQSARSLSRFFETVPGQGRHFQPGGAKGGNLHACSPAGSDDSQSSHCY